ncbi:YdcF family protein [Sansalvadorimonas sp. 2012CJ34-2]|uniref:YdcF family protein n=1 Tax=Parendozoicomonas callyspongiae TaxID=2942213 RepID=A0ABT0PGK4_9GAMM|nr:ElyC/SanA/YdcF family protein [Sansalvadorimonas sp. 2012CJ34-2]MCL6270515.1 YdcF family protein [Sansalvadorimonas sp. 2012CJ34-2]
MSDWMTRKRMLILLTLAISGVMTAVAVSSLFVARQASPYLYDDIQALPGNKVGIVLGTSRYTSEGNLNGHYRRRLEAVTALVRAHKIKYVLVSGDNGTRWYDEPTRMKRDLVRMGISPDIIYRDYAGFRTLDSIIRAKKVFGLENFTVITQRFHNERALFLARAHGISAIGFNARGTLVQTDFSNRIREALARVLAIIETYILGTGAQVLGPEIVIGDTPPT